MNTFLNRRAGRQCFWRTAGCCVAMPIAVEMPLALRSNERCCSMKHEKQANTQQTQLNKEMMQLLKPAEVAQMLRCSEKILANWRSSRLRGPRFVKCGSLVRYRLGDVLAFIEDQTITP
ncbi:hypothetical protein D3C72_699770 [compost metagenome]